MSNTNAFKVRIVEYCYRTSIVFFLESETVVENKENAFRIQKSRKEKSRGVITHQVVVSSQHTPQIPQRSN